MISHAHLGIFHTHTCQAYLGKTNTHNRYIPYLMSEQSDRLRQARLAAGFTRQADAIRAFDFNRNTYKSNENGNAEFSYDQAEIYGRAFNVRTEWLYRNEGPMRKGNLPSAKASYIPVVGLASAGSEGIYLNAYSDGAHPPLDMFPEGSIAVDVKGESMEPRFFEGEKIVFGPIAPDPHRHIGKEVLVYLGDDDGRTLIKILDANRATNGWSLRSYNPRHPPIEVTSINWVRPLLGMII